MNKTTVSTDTAPQPVAAYAQASRKGNIVQVAGQVGLDPSTGNLVGSSVAEQTEQVLSNIESILRACGASIDDVLMMRAYLTDIGHFDEFNAVYNRLAREPYPARTTVYVGLPPGVLVEIDALAVVD